MLTGYFDKTKGLLEFQHNNFSHNHINDGFVVIFKKRHTRKHLSVKYDV